MKKDTPTILKELRKHHNLTMDELAERLNQHGDIKSSKQTIYRWEKGLISPHTKTIDAYSKVFNVTPAYILGKEEEKRELPPSNACIIDGDFIKMIPLFGSVSAGFGSLHDEYIEMIPIVLQGNPNNYVAITVNGDSMETRIMDKSIVVVNKNCPIYNGDIGIFRVNDEFFVKQKIIKDKKTYLHSFNEFYKDIEITEYDEYVELGKVTKIITNC